MENHPSAALWDETLLDHRDSAIRRAALQAGRSLVRNGARAAARPINLHAHTFFSFNCRGYSPSRYAWQAWQAGFEVAGIVDFDVLDGLEEFHRAGGLLNLRTVVSLETRTFVEELADCEINSPGEPGVAYHMAAGFATLPIRTGDVALLAGLREQAAQRLREQVARINAFADPIRVDFERDVLPLTPAGNATERHLCLACARKAPPDFWMKKLQASGGEMNEPESPRALNFLRSKLMKRGGPGYIRPDRNTFPPLAVLNRFALSAGAIPTVAWLDGTTAGELDIERWLDIAAASGAAALNIIPARNFTPGAKDQKLQNLYDVVDRAVRRGWPVMAGTEMNSFGQELADDFDCAELRPIAPVFREGAFILYAHTALQRAAGLGYLSSWAAGLENRNAVFAEIGRRLMPSSESRLRGVHDAMTAAEVLRRL